MEVYSFPTGPIMVNTYLAFDETRKAFIVDPGGASPSLLNNVFLKSGGIHAAARTFYRLHLVAFCMLKSPDVEFDQLQLELSTWTTSPRIEKIAREKLKMHTSEAGRVLTVSTRNVAR